MKGSAIAFVQVITLMTSMILFSCGNGGEGRTGVSASATPGDTASIFFTEYEHNFGQVTAGEKVACVFTFGNRGKAPLVISSATTSCGCTVSKYNTEPVSPGATGTIEVIFDSSGRNGKQTKTITVSSNAAKPVVLLRITGEVLSGNNN